MTDKPKPKRRWLQFSLRTMLVVVTVFCVWLGITAKRARDQKQAVETILAVGGSIHYEHQWTATFGTDETIPPGPEWLRRLIGDEYFFRVLAVYFWRPQVNDASLAVVKRFTDLTDLMLSEANISDAGLVHLTGLTKLKTLDLEMTPITDAGLVHLRGLNNLRWLSLYNTQITDAGLTHLEGLTNLQFLILDATKVTDEGVKKLQQALPNCNISSSLQ